MAVLITGCSTGIGRQAVHDLRAAGETVVATARNLDDLDEFAEEGVMCLPLDVTNSRSMQDAVDRVIKKYGKIDALVNNAGYGAYMPMEETSPAEMQAMFDVNVFGLHELTLLVLPHMRKERYGRIVNVASIAGHLSFPMMGAYCATKFAVRAMSMALRVEAKPFNIHVSLIEPGRIRTEFGNRAKSESNAPEGSPYALLHERFNRIAEKGRGKDATVISKRIVRACTSARPKFHYLAPSDAKWGNFLKRMLPDAWILGATARVTKWR